MSNLPRAVFLTVAAVVNFHFNSQSWCKTFFHFVIKILLTLFYYAPVKLEDGHGQHVHVLILILVTRFFEQ